MKYDCLVSVIVPVYNCARYVTETVHSILRQSFDDFEIVLVNDGSSDESEFVCKTLAEMNDKVKFYSQENKGVTKARALGVAKARGEWILFVDADDLLPPGVLSVMMKRRNEGDVIIGQVDYTFPDQWRYPRISEEISSLQAILYLFDGTIHCGPYARLFKRKLFVDGVFDVPREVIKGEDFIMNLRLLRQSNRVVVIPDVVYNYIYRSSSVIASVNPFFRLSYCRLHERCVLDSLDFRMKFFIPFLSLCVYHRKVFIKNKVKSILNFLGLLKFVKSFFG